MTLGQTYPAIQLDSNGKVVDSGVEIQFTDSSNEPGGGASVAWLEVVVNNTAEDFSLGPDIVTPVGVGGPVIPSFPVQLPASGYFYVQFENNNPTDVVLTYVELDVVNADYSEGLGVFTQANITVPAMASYLPTQADFSGTIKTIGTDLTLVDQSGVGGLTSAAGGVFFTQIAFDFT